MASLFSTSKARAPWRLGLIAAAIAAAALPAPGAARAADRACAGPDFGHKADAVLAPYEQVQAFSGTVLVARDGKVRLRRAIGLANREWGVPNVMDGRFRIGSVTKQFTAAAILQLAEQGKLSIDDPISKYYAEAPAAWSKVTLRRLLTHTSGIPSYTAIPGFFAGPARLPRTPEEIIELTRDQPLQFEPGSKFAYDNTGYILLGYVIEKVSGQSYADYLQDHIFGPLGMADTGYDVTGRILLHRVSGYSYGPAGWANASFLDMSVPYAAGSLYSTVGDLFAWEQALFGGKVVGPASLKLMTTDWGHGYGFGLGVGQLQGHALISHEGGINGFASSLQRFPADGVTSIVLSNFDGAQSQHLAAQLALLCMGEPADPPRVRLNPAVLDRYAGDYELKPALNIRIVREDDHLLASAPGQLPIRLYARDRDAFFSRIRGGDFTFDLDAHGASVALVLHGPGPDVRLNRVAGP